MDTPWALVCDKHLLVHLLVKPNGEYQPKRLWLLSLLWLMIIFSLAGPSWRDKAVPTVEKNINRVILIDLSDNMLGRDLVPSRLAWARFKLRDIFNANQEGQIGLIAYAGEAYVVSPLTYDAKTLSDFIDSLSPDIMPVPGNRLSMALMLADKLFEAVNVSHGELIVMSAGVVDEEARHVAKMLSQKGYHISVLGIGSSLPYPLIGSDGSYKHDKAGNILFSTFQEKTLMDLAREGKGTYVALRKDNTDVAILMQQTLNSKSLQQQKGVIRVWYDDGYYFVFVILALALCFSTRKWVKRLCF